MNNEIENLYSLLGRLNNFQLKKLCDVFSLPVLSDLPNNHSQYDLITKIVYYSQKPSDSVVDICCWAKRELGETSIDSQKSDAVQPVHDDNIYPTSANRDAPAEVKSQDTKRPEEPLSSSGPGNPRPYNWPEQKLGKISTVKSPISDSPPSDHGKLRPRGRAEEQELGETSTESRVDFLIITPMEEELEAVRSKFSGLKKFDDYQYKGSVKCDNGTNYNVIISCLHSSKREIGPVQAAAATARWIEQWQPSNLLLEGIAAGVKGKVNLGDILIPAEIGDVTITTRTDNGESVIPKQRSFDKELFDKCKVPNWEKLITISRPAKRSKVALHTGGCIISGSSKMQVADWTTAYQGVCEKLHGFEMEASGVMTALDRIVGKPKPKFMMIRAVSDFGGANRKEEQEKWEKYACDVAAVYTYAFLKSGPVPALNETQS